MSRNVGRVQICCRQGRLGAAWRATRGQALGAFARDPSARRLLQDVTSRFVSNGCRKANHLFSRLQRKAVHLRRRPSPPGRRPTTRRPPWMSPLHSPAITHAHVKALQAERVQRVKSLRHNEKQFTSQHTAVALPTIWCMPEGRPTPRPGRWAAGLFTTPQH